MDLKDLGNEELRHTLAHLWCALDALAEGQRATTKRHLVDCEAAIFTEEEQQTMAHTPCHKRPKPKPKRPSKPKPKPKR